MAKVKAIRDGFFGERLIRAESDNNEFECPTKAEFSTNWMELLPGESFDEEAPKKRGRKAKVEEEAPEETEES